MGCSSSKKEPTVLRQQSSAILKVPKKQLDVPEKKLTLIQEDDSSKFMNDKENKINLILKAKRQNMFAHGYDLSQHSFATDGVQKTAEDEKLIRKILESIR